MARRGARKAKAQAGQEPSAEHFSKSKTLPGWECEICRPRPPVLNITQALAHEQTAEHSAAVAAWWSGPLQPDAATWDAPVQPERDSPEARQLRGLEHRGWVDMAGERVGFWLRGIERAERGEEPESMDKFVEDLERAREKRALDSDWGAPPAPDGWGDGAKWSNDGKNGWGAWDQGDAGWGETSAQAKGKGKARDNTAGQGSWDAWDAAGPSRATPVQDNPAGQNGWDLWDPKEQANGANGTPLGASRRDNSAGQNGWDLWDPVPDGADPSPITGWAADDNPGGQHGWAPWDPTQAHDADDGWAAHDRTNQYEWEPWDPTAEASRGTTIKKPSNKAWAQPNLWVHPAASRESSPASVGKVARQSRRQRQPFSKTQVTTDHRRG
ncbi:unnamed protein product [Peniophora sp. CBMAI 1063]|nr:unnamed protein product [Peniophora sp. CBMAI 1063]